MLGSGHHHQMSVRIWMIQFAISALVIIGLLKHTAERLLFVMLHLWTFSLCSHRHYIIYLVDISYVWGRIFRGAKHLIGCGKSTDRFHFLEKKLYKVHFSFLPLECLKTSPLRKICQIRFASIGARVGEVMFSPHPDLTPNITPVSISASSVWPESSAALLLVTDCTSCQLGLDLTSQMSSHLRSPPPHYPLLRVMTLETCTVSVMAPVSPM